MGDYKTAFGLATCSAGNFPRSQGHMVNAYRFGAEICVGSIHGNTNRLWLLNTISGLGRGIADWREVTLSLLREADL